MIKGIDEIHYYTNPGGRSLNEDTILVQQMANSVLALAADGMGGKPGGEIASKIAVEYLKKRLENQEVSADLLYDAVMEANQEVLDGISEKSPRTTIAVLWLDQDQAMSATVGDTRIYQFREGTIRFQSTDHTVAQLSVQSGKLTPETLRQSEERFQLLYALGSKDEIRIDIHNLDVKSGDCFLICTDGFWEYVREQEMMDDLMKSRNAGAWLKKMKSRVISSQKENSDNYSAIVMSLE